MSRPTPTIGDVNVRGFILPATCGGDIEALESIYGQRKADEYNPLIFYIPGGHNFAEGQEVLFDVVAHPFTRGAVASNVRAVS
jgi:hypothetical protein